MKIILIIFLGVVLAGFVYFFYLSYKSQTGSAPGLVNSKLTPCSHKPNCICTEYPDDTSHFTDAIKTNDLNIDNISKIIASTGGVIITTEESYIAATYTSSFFRYVDDLEIRIEPENQLIHIRSASRVGHSDMGINLKRIKNLRNILNIKN